MAIKQLSAERPLTTRKCPLRFCADKPYTNGGKPYFMWSGMTALHPVPAIICSRSDCPLAESRQLREGEHIWRLFVVRPSVGRMSDHEQTDARLVG